MPTASRGEVWPVDLGMAAKIRPCVVLSVPAAEDLITVPNAKLMRRLGSLSAERLAAVESAVRRWLGL